jgi:hypothetical protein
MSKRIALLLVLLLSLGITLPLARSAAHGIRQSVESQPNRKYRRHSRAWWRRHHARIRQRRAAALAHRNSLLSAGMPQNISLNDPASGAFPSLPTALANSTINTALKAPAPTVTAKLPGQMSLSVVALSRPNPAFLTSREQNRLLAGVAVSDLRRIVIDKMITSGGWVINDFVRDVNGSRVFVVTAHTPRDGTSPEKAWNFYFTEVGGRIYSLTTNAPVESAERMAAEAEHFIVSMRSNSQSTNR